MINLQFQCLSGSSVSSAPIALVLIISFSQVSLQLVRADFLILILNSLSPRLISCVPLR